MPQCCAHGCYTQQKKGAKLYTIPQGEREKERRNIWIERINRGKWVPSKSSRLCENHFTEDQFENRRADGVRKLKPNAIPSRFSHTSPTIRIPSRVRNNVDGQADINHFEAGNAEELAYISASQQECNNDQQQEVIVLQRELDLMKKELKKVVKENESLTHGLGKEMMRCWRSMKDSYVKSLKNQEGKSGDPAKCKKPCVSHKQLSFIQSVSQPRETSGNTNTAGPGQTIDDIDELELNNAASPLVTQSIVQASRLANKKRKSGEDGFEREIVNILKANMGQSQTSNTDPDEMFFLSQIPLIKTLSRSDKLHFQAKFMELLQSYSVPSIYSNPRTVVNEASTSSF